MPRGIQAGEKYARLTVIHFVRRNEQSTAIWSFRCDCGREIEVRGISVKNGNTKSCGCLSVEVSKSRHLKHGHKANGRVSPEYRAWIHMNERCTNPHENRYARYGGRGIKVCERWRHNFEAFFEDMGPRPSPNHSLDRYPNSDGDYEPNNCRWATTKEQSRNRSNTRFVTYAGRRMPLGAACELAGLRYSMVQRRLALGWSDARALTP